MPNDPLRPAPSSGVRGPALNPAAVERVLARAATPPTAGEARDLATRLAGPAEAAATRIVPGTPGAVLDALGRWLEREECMRLARRTGDGSPHSGAQALWEPRTDFVGNLARGLRLGVGLVGVIVVMAVLPQQGVGGTHQPRRADKTVMGAW